MLVPVFSMRGKNDIGIGDMSAVKETIDFSHKNGMTLLQVLPVNYLGKDSSPYNSLSSKALEPAYISLEMIPELSSSDLNIQEELKMLLTEGNVKYKAIRSLKEKMLKVAFNKNSNNEEFNEFCKQEWTSEFGLYICGLKKFKNQDWTTWGDWKNPKIAKALLNEEDKKEVKFQQYIQFVAYKQWGEIKEYAESKNIELMGDMPFGINAHSADVWNNKEMVDLEWYIGVPPSGNYRPDPFTAQYGQNWGLPAYKWEVQEKDNFKWWKERVESLGKLFHICRIDFAGGYINSYAFPWKGDDNKDYIGLSWHDMFAKTGGKSPKFYHNSDTWDEREKTKVRGHQLLSVIKNAADMKFIAEDVGYVPDGTKQILDSLDIGGCVIPQWERSWDNGEFTHPDHLKENAVVYYANHDNEPLKAYWERLVEHWTGPDGEQGWKEMQSHLRYFGWNENIPPPTEFNKEVHGAWIKSLLHSKSKYVSIMFTDVVGESKRLNLPGSESDANWTQRLPDTWENLEKIIDLKQRFEIIRELHEEIRPSNIHQNSQNSVAMNPPSSLELDASRL